MNTDTYYTLSRRSLSYTIDVRGEFILDQLYFEMTFASFNGLYNPELHGITTKGSILPLTFLKWYFLKIKMYDQIVGASECYWSMSYSHAPFDHNESNICRF